LEVYCNIQSDEKNTLFLKLFGTTTISDHHGNFCVIISIVSSILHCKAIFSSPISTQVSTEYVFVSTAVTLELLVVVCGALSILPDTDVELLLPVTELSALVF
jgi:hypothetical protein